MSNTFWVLSLTTSAVSNWLDKAEIKWSLGSIVCGFVVYDLYLCPRWLQGRNPALTCDASLWPWAVSHHLALLVTYLVVRALLVEAAFCFASGLWFRCVWGPFMRRVLPPETVTLAARAWTLYEDAWDSMDRFADIDSIDLAPWPCARGIPSAADTLPVLNFYAFRLHSMATLEEVVRLLERERRRWHPDRAVSRLGRHMSTAQRHQLQLRATAVFQTIDSMLAELRLLDKLPLMPHYYRPKAHFFNNTIQGELTDAQQADLQVRNEHAAAALARQHQRILKWFNYLATMCILLLLNWYLWTWSTPALAGLDLGVYPCLLIGQMRNRRDARVTFAWCILLPIELPD
ncbi:hypothetical protein KVT40_009211 [Elsinoe batatas]|uniref:Uncharacterized protein n=1 Tax=Elsinoe batatas TaxID=2601811 RepID=A0A8K0KS98_9PEZI|nr:hypothetical protein KVT40_009211 [Elsinoe batatas]